GPAPPGPQLRGAGQGVRVRRGAAAPRAEEAAEGRPALRRPWAPPYRTASFRLPRALNGPRPALRRCCAAHPGALEPFGRRAGPRGCTGRKRGASPTRRAAPARDRPGAVRRGRAEGPAETPKKKADSG